MFERLRWLSTLDLALLLTDYVTIALGLAIGYIAYRGYRNNRHTPMLFVAVGFVLLMGVPGVLGVLYFALPGGQTVLAVLTQASEVAGMCSILYGLWVDPE
ncbi:hypothetical protein EXE43_10285 [Halorubrum sp. SS5]|uniref:Uncharacterized protein n=1 Tax=Halorubrum salinarum TaxID=2739057 RepID=A0A7D3YBQ7_9EURY|nr:hypothetical protein [Halorubrum salinarum]QKG93745.1 hypothetical protein HPS36_13065 [Halorubrum salinarum]TKX86064.1 hypothetical protein EXE43_10285 [Halorubrum sp. SS5]